MWPLEATSRLRDDVRRVARRIEIGDSPAHALSSALFLGEEAPLVATAFSMRSTVGSSPVEILEFVVTSLRDRAEFDRAAGAGAAGARMSARLIAGLPLAFLPLLPSTRSALLDRTGSALLLLGIALCMVGFRWISSLVPSPPADDEVARLAELLAGALEGGATLRSALSSMTGYLSHDLEEEVVKLTRRLRLGSSWASAFEHARGDLVALGRVVVRFQERGLPLADPLREFARSRRASLRSDFEVAMRRAPVAMVLPLTLCVLPAYALLGVAPFIRNINPV
jgi:tight adherence protein B